MDYRRRERYDYFLIWGNGVPSSEDIVDIIRCEESIKILRIMYHRVKNVARLIHAVYSYDYAPLQHLRSKTDYLLKADSQAIFVFVRNLDVKEVYRGDGAFRHMECSHITRIKEDIRNRFNPRRDGKRTEEHVVHASDNEMQVDHMLKYLGLKQGIGILDNAANPLLASLPYYLPRFERFDIRCIPSSALYCNILRGTRESFWQEQIPIGETPQFACLTGDTLSYGEYLSRFMGGPLTCDYSVEKLIGLSRSLVYLQDSYATSYILVQEFEPGKYVILDGVHRASVLKFRGVDSFVVAVMK
jgi:hypothetical protein